MCQRQEDLHRSIAREISNHLAFRYMGFKGTVHSFTIEPLQNYFELFLQTVLRNFLTT